LRVRENCNRFVGTPIARHILQQYHIERFWRPTMNFKRILLATDFSEYSNAALEVASRLASESHARLYIVHVDGIVSVGVPAIPPVEGAYYYDAPLADERHEISERLNKIAPTVPNLAYEHCYLTGLPVDQILKFADREHVDLIVIGSHGRTGLSRLLMGSVAEGVARKANCHVLVVKQPVTALGGTCSEAETVRSKALKIDMELKKDVEKERT
jgi:universal stress protein A